jgi:hypothetical protein
MKEEYVSGSHGIEGRYPFLDKMVVQEFLWLKPQLKNAKYKSVLHQYMTEHDYPFDENQKVGFNCGFTSNMGQSGPFSNKGMYTPQITAHRTVGVALDETRVVKWEREVAKTLGRRKRHTISNEFSSN